MMGCEEGHGQGHGHGRHRCRCEEDRECDCNCGGGHCQCGHGGNGGGEFRRRYQTKAEQIAELEAYAADLKAEVQAVEEQLAELRK